jgi:hypothetical protein
MKKKYYWIVGIVIAVILISIFIFGNSVDALINGIINKPPSLNCNSDSDCNLVYEQECYGCSVPKCINGEYKGYFCMFTKYSLFGNLYAVLCNASDTDIYCKCINNRCSGVSLMTAVAKALTSNFSINSDECISGEPGTLRFTIKNNDESSDLSELHAYFNGELLDVKINSIAPSSISNEMIVSKSIKPGNYDFRIIAKDGTEVSKVISCI